MYVLFEFLFLFFSLVYGEMIQCFIGGIVKYDTRSEDIAEIQKNYCNTLVRECFVYKSYINLFGILLTPRNYEWIQILDIEIDEDNIDTPFMADSYFVSNYYSDITRNAGLKPIQNELVFHETHSMTLLHSGKTIVEYWDDIVRMGTDMHRLKFHSKLLSLYRRVYPFTTEEVMIFLKSSYSVINIYYLTNNQFVARGLAMDGMHVLSRNTYKLYKNKHINHMEILMWEILTHIAYIENHNISHEMNRVAGIVPNFQSLLRKFNQYISQGNDYPCSYLLKFRSVLLDTKLVSENKELEECSSMIKNGPLMNCSTHSNNKTYQLYMNIISSMYDPEIEYIKGLTSFNNLLNALKIPVFTSEDRILNYKVTTMAMNKISDCVNQDAVWMEYENECLCNTLKINRENDGAITRLENYIQNLEKYPGITDNVEYLRELMRAHKWLAELHGVLCTDRNNGLEIKIRQEVINTSLTMAIMLQGQYNFDDDHLEFLYYKKICKDSQLSYSWERYYNADGWAQNLASFSGEGNRYSIFLQSHECIKVSKFLGINHQFIHQADVNILLFKHLIMTHYMNITMEGYVQNALSHWVVTSEDRVRNLQAHDLYSMYFVWENYKIVKEQA